MKGLTCAHTHTILLHGSDNVCGVVTLSEECGGMVCMSPLLGVMELAHCWQRNCAAQPLFASLLFRICFICFLFLSFIYFLFSMLAISLPWLFIAKLVPWSSLCGTEGMDGNIDYLFFLPPPLLQSYWPLYSRIPVFFLRASSVLKLGMH